MNILLYTIIFIMGTIFGSFLTLATYRIPLNQDITHKRSYCPKCNHKLSFLDMIPIFSYIFLKGKCRYCKTKISPRYFVIEILSGVAFVLLGIALNIDIYNLTKNSIMEFCIGVLYIIFVFLIAGIDKEHHKIDKRVLIYGIVISSISVIYNAITETNYNVNRILIYLIIIAILTVINIILTKKNKSNDYMIDSVIFCLIISVFTYEIATIISIIGTLLIISIKLLLSKIVNNEERNVKEMPIAFYLSISNAITLIIIFIYHWSRI